MYVKNPVRRGFYPDPSLCRVGEDYYCVHSSFACAPGIPIFHSRNLAEWEQIGHALVREEQLRLEGAEISGGIYAPAIRYHKGIFYITATNVTAGYNFYITAEKPKGPWSDPWVLEGAPGIDPSLFFDGDRCYYVGQRQKENAAYFGDCEIWLQELDLERRCLTGKPAALWDGAMKRTWWPEGPHLYRRGEYYYLIIAEGGTEYHHSICAARSKSLLGPYESCPDNPIFTHRHLGHRFPVQNVGHGDLVDTPQGGWYMMMLGTRPRNGRAELGRETFLADVSWEEDWPVINAGEGRLREKQLVRLPGERLAEGECPEEGEWREEGECPEEEDREGASGPNEYGADQALDKAGQESPKSWASREIRWERPLDFRLVGIRGFLPDLGGCEMRDGRLFLPASPGGMEDPGIPPFLGVRMESRTFHISVWADVSRMSESGEAGLCCFYNEENYLLLGIRREGARTKASVISSRQGRRSLMGETYVSGLEGKAGGCPLRIKGLGQKAELWAEEERLAWDVDLGYMSGEAAGGFVGCLLGVYAQGERGCGIFGPLSVLMGQ